MTDEPRCPACGMLDDVVEHPRQQGLFRCDGTWGCGYEWDEDCPHVFRHHGMWEKEWSQ